MPQISIIIPAYNAESTILGTIESVFQQTFQDFEVIVIDDGSTDRTVRILQDIKDDRLKIFSYENGGVCVARNRGISQSIGKFIAFLDADDLWTPDKLELQLMALEEHPEAGVAYSWTTFTDVDAEGKAVALSLSSSYQFAGNVYEQLLVSDFVHSGSNALVRRPAVEATGEFDSTCAGCADWDYWLRLSVHWPFVVVPKHQVFYRRAAGSMSSNVEKMRKEALVALEKAYQTAPSDLQHLKSRTLANLYKYCASLYLQHSLDINGTKRAGQDLWSAIYTRPQELLDRTTLKLLIKFLIKRSLPPQVADYLTQMITTQGNKQ